MTDWHQHVKNKWDVLSEEKKEAILERFGGDCFEDIEQELVNNYLYARIRKAIKGRQSEIMGL